ncbi:MAG: malto-oligosyltrehalose trehalohydrolase [Bacteroidota bacterium]
MLRPVGAIYLGAQKCRFTVWAPEKSIMTLHIVSPDDRMEEMQKDHDGYFTVELNGIEPGTQYYYIIDNRDVPDPASYYQPDGVHGPSQVIDHQAHKWADNSWRGLPLKDLILYELHIGTFTDEGTFESAISRLDDLVKTGINAIEIMPIGQFPGSRNWGYDGVYPYAAQNSYGGPEGLKKLVDACHARGLAVYLDVVYNHLGPQGNYLGEFAPYFTDKYGTPWGKAVNLDGNWSDGVRNYCCYNAIYWLRHFHIDGLRLDAIHQMYDFGAVHFWELLHTYVKTEEQECGRHLYLIAESDLNNPKIVKHPEAGGYGFDAQWLDDFHHSLFVLLYEKGLEQYEDFGKIEQLAKAYTDGFVHSGEFVNFRKRKFGAPSTGIPGDRFVIFNQNHDQVGNTADGGRLSMNISLNGLKVAAAALLLAPYIPMLFMGEEYGDRAPFPYFVSHTDKALIEAVKAGRKREFANIKNGTEPPDPQSESTFNSAKLRWQSRDEGEHGELLAWNKRLIQLRKNSEVLQNFNKNDIRVNVINEKAFTLYRRSEDGESHLLALFNLGSSSASYILPGIASEWKLELASADDVLAAAVHGETVILPGISVAVYLAYGLA